MTYYTEEQLNRMGFKSLGVNVKISDKASIYDCDKISVGDNSRVDDFCVLSGNIIIGRNVHVTPNCLIAGGIPGAILEDFTTLAYRVMIFTQSDDYSGHTMTNSTVPKKYKQEEKKEVIVRKYSIVGAGSTVMPGVTLEEGTAVGAMTLVLKSTDPWGVYVGIPAKRLKDRDSNLLKLVREYLKHED